jgi:hypothetical protein
LRQYNFVVKPPVPDASAQGHAPNHAMELESACVVIALPEG